MLDILQIIGALVLLFFLPGFMVVQALFPRKHELDLDFDWLYRITLGIGLSIVLTILVGFGLNSLGVNEATGKGYVTAGPITLTLVLLTLIIFLIAWFRGAFPIMGRWHPALIRFPPRDPRIGDIPYIVDKRMRFQYQTLMEDKYKLVDAISKAEKLLESHSGEQRKYFEERRKRLLDDKSKVEKDISELELEIMDMPSEEVKADEE